MKLRIGIPKGSLQEATLELFARAGLPAYTNGRSYFARTSDPEIDGMLIRAQEMARYVEHGAIDAGLTGFDWVVESGLEVVTVSDLIYAKRSRGQSAMGAGGPGGFFSSASRRSLGKNRRHRTGESYPRLLLQKTCRSAGGVFLGSDRGQAAYVGGRHCRSDRDRQFA